MFPKSPGPKNDAFLHQFWVVLGQLFQSLVANYFYVLSLDIGKSYQ